MSIIKSGIIVGILTLCSRILGYTRDILVASFLGAGFLADAYVVAFKLPNFFRRIFAEGGLSPAFIPIYAQKNSEGEHKAKIFADKVFTMLFLSLLIFVALMEIAMPLIMYALAPGFDKDKEKFDLAVLLSRITTPYLLFISLVALLSGILNTVGKFAAAAASPILLNLSMVFALLYLTKYTETPAHSVCIGIFIAGILQLIAITITAKRLGVMPQFRKPKIDADMRLLLKKMVPVVVGGGIVQINLWVDTIIATLLPSGAVSLLYYADRLSQLPLGMIGVAMGTVLLPELSRKIKEKKIGEVASIQNRSIEVALFLTLPCAMVLGFAAKPIIHVLFERGEFLASATSGSSLALSAFAFGLPAFILGKIYITSFFANLDTSTPVKIAFSGLIINVILNLVLMGPLQHVGIALATSITAWINLATFGFISVKREIFIFDRQIIKKVPKIILSSVLMAVSLYFGEIYLHESIYGSSSFGKISALIILFGFSGSIYMIACVLSNAINISEIKKTFRRKKLINEED